MEPELTRIKKRAAKALAGLIGTTAQGAMVIPDGAAFGESLLRYIFNGADPQYQHPAVDFLIELSAKMSAMDPTIADRSYEALDGVMHTGPLVPEEEHLRPPVPGNCPRCNVPWAGRKCLVCKGRR